MENENESLNYNSLYLDLKIDYIINKIKIVNINNLSIILNCNNNFSSNKFIFDIKQEKYNYDFIKIKKLIVGIKDSEIEDTFPNNDDTIYMSFIQYPNHINITKKTLNEIESIFCLLYVYKPKIEKHDEQEIALFLFTLQYWNYLLGSYKKYGWIHNLLAIVYVNKKYYIYTIKIKKEDIENFIKNGKKFNYDFNEIIIEKYKINNDDKKEIINYLGFNIFDVFNEFEKDNILDFFDIDRQLDYLFSKYGI